MALLQDRQPLQDEHVGHSRHLTPKTAMKTPSVLCRTAKNDDVMKHHDRIIIAKGPFIIMAYGYLSLPEATRGCAWIQCPHGDVMPDEIETVMRQWHEHTKLAPDPR